MTTTTKPKKSKSEKAGKTPRQLKDDPSITPLAPWLPGYRPLDPPKLGSDPLPERPEGPPPSGAAVADQEGGGPDRSSLMVVLAMIPIGGLLVGGAYVAFTRWRRGPVSLS